MICDLSLFIEHLWYDYGMIFVPEYLNERGHGVVCQISRYRKSELTYTTGNCAGVELMFDAFRKRGLGIDEWFIYRHSVFLSWTLVRGDIRKFWSPYPGVCI